MAEQYSLPDVLARLYENQLAIEAALMELVLLEEKRGSSEACDKCSGCAGNNWRECRAYQAGDHEVGTKQWYFRVKAFEATLGSLSRITINRSLDAEKLRGDASWNLCTFDHLDRYSQLGHEKCPPLGREIVHSETHSKGVKNLPGLGLFAGAV
jgi:hypothetical protein